MDKAHENQEQLEFLQAQIMRQMGDVGETPQSKHRRERHDYMQDTQNILNAHFADEKATEQRREHMKTVNAKRRKKAEEPKREPSHRRTHKDTRVLPTDIKEDTVDVTEQSSNGDTDTTEE